MIHLLILLSAGNAQENRSEITVTNDNRRLIFSLRQMPPSRLSCELTHPIGERVEVTWDPLIQSPLSQTVVLPKTDGLSASWDITCWSLPLTRQVDINIALNSPQTKTREFEQHYAGEIDMAWVMSNTIPESSKATPEELEYYSWLARQCSFGEDHDQVHNGLLSQTLTDASGDTTRQHCLFFDVPRVNYLANFHYTEDIDEGHTIPLINPANRVPTVVVMTNQPMLLITQQSLYELDNGNAHSALTGLYNGGQTKGRSFLTSSAPDVVTDTIEILAEIAVGRAQAATMDAMAEKLSYTICQQAVVPESTRLNDWLEIPSGPVLENTCSAVEDMPMEELFNSAADISAALHLDALGFSYDTLVESLITSPKAALQQHVGPLLRDTRPVFLRLAERQSAPGPIEGQMILAALAEHDWLGSPPTELECGMALSVAVASACVESDGCSAGDISKRIHHPDEFFTLNATCDGYFSTAAPTWQDMRPELMDLAAALAESALPSTNLTDRQRAALINDTFFDAALLLVEHAAKVQDISDEERDILAPMLTHLKNMTTAMLEEDDRKLVIESVDLLLFVFDAAFDDWRYQCKAEKQETKDNNPGVTGSALKALEPYKGCLASREDARDADDDSFTTPRGTARRAQKVLERSGPWVTVLASNAEALKTEYATPEEAEQARTARVEAIEGVIDETTRRTDRDGQIVVSAGGNVGMTSASDLFDSDVSFGTEAFNLAESPYLTVPMGVGLQYLPDRRRKGRDRLRPLSLGVHSQLTLVDPANLLNVADDGNDDVQWNDFLVVGGQVGLIVGTPSLPLNFGVDWRYVPSETNTVQPGIYLSYYVPFLDFN